jgi:hypothetical protein
MLKIWKQTWKKEDESRRSQSGKDIDHDEGTSDVALAPASSSGDSVSVPHDAQDKSGKKRIRNVELQTPDSTDPPLKKSKVERAEIRDSLRDYLPEVLETDDTVASPLLASSIEDQILEQAKRENSEYLTSI